MLQWVRRAGQELGLPKVNARLLKQAHRLLYLNGQPDVNLIAAAAGIGPQNLGYKFVVCTAGGHDTTPVDAGQLALNSSRS